MRLNRVLLLAATISMMMFALVFTISCSGDDGKDGKNGSNCSVEANGDAFNVICNGEEIGILQGTGDRDGKNGENGANGKNGSYCIVGTQLTSAGGLEIRCNGEVKGTLDACKIEEVSNVELQITCGKTTKINTCKDEVFDATKKYCKTDGTGTDDIKKNEGVCQDGKKYYKTIQYCGYASATATKRTALNKCHYSLTTQPNEGIDVHAVPKYNTNVQCLAAGGDTTKVSGSSTDRCILNLKDRGKSGNGEGITDLTKCLAAGADTLRLNTGSSVALNTDILCVSPWQNEYCRYTSPKTTVAPEVSDSLCAGDKLNAGKWNGEYCGYLEKVDGKGNFKKRQTGLCDDFGEASAIASLGPNEVAFGSAYCEVKFENRFSGKTTYQNVLCGYTTKNKPNNGKWLKEYCGYTAPTSSSSSVKEKVYNDICDDGVGPQSLGYNAKNYCRVLYKDRFSGVTTATTTFCGKNGQVNKDKWNSQYCSFDKTNDPEKASVKSPVCDDGTGPNENGWSSGAEYCEADKKGKTILSTNTCDNGDKINDKEWKGEYCGLPHKDSTATVRQTGACGDGKGPNSESFGGGYCAAVNKDGDLEYTPDFCGADGKPNDGKWNGEYCGYASATAAEADKIYTGVCDNGTGPNQDGFEAGYCRWTTETSTGTEFAEMASACGGVKINEGSWKGEYCYADEKPAVCTGGRVPNLDKKSTDPYTVRCSFTNNDLVCSDSNLKSCDKDGCADLGEEYKWNEESFECLSLASED